MRSSTGRSAHSPAVGPALPTARAQHQHSGAPLECVPAKGRSSEAGGQAAGVSSTLWRSPERESTRGASQPGAARRVPGDRTRREGSQRVQRSLWASVLVSYSLCL